MKGELFFILFQYLFFIPFPLVDNYSGCWVSNHEELGHREGLVFSETVQTLLGMEGKLAGRQRGQ